jgi:hypothetical protein
MLLRLYVSYDYALSLSPSLQPDHDTPIDDHAYFFAAITIIIIDLMIQSLPSCRRHRRRRPNSLNLSNHY